MAQLNNCQHCGSVVEFLVNDQGPKQTVLAQCTNCKIQTQPLAESVEYSAMEKIAEIWNSRTSEEWPAWIQPIGAHDAYSKGAKVTHNDGHWISNVDSNVWEPGVYGWTKQ